MANYDNFFETKKEADMRLRGTIVLYDGQPYYVLLISDHLPDGIFRIYLDPIGPNMTMNNFGLPDPCGQSYDEFMKAHPEAPMLRKMMNSPKFNKFRPFPLGMCNTDTTALYVERQPTRKTEQGLTSSMLSVSKIHLIGQRNNEKLHNGYFNIYSEEFRACIMGEYPSPQACLSALKNPKIANDAAAFNREFAFVRGPLGSIYLGYKDSVIGQLVNNDLSLIRLGEEFLYTKEVVESLNLFGVIQTNV